MAAPEDAVWRALREPAELRRWFGWDAPGLAEEIEDIFESHALPAEDERVLRFDDIPDRFELQARGANETLVRLIGAPLDPDAYDGMHEGWLGFMAQLRFALERHPGKNRRTLYLTGQTPSAGGDTVMAALGLPELESAGSAGDDYEVRGDDGQVALAGEVWARSARQTAITVGGGTGLLVATQLPAAVAPPNGGATAIITSYDLSDDEFQRVRQSWTSWWQTRFSGATATVWPE